MSVVVGVTTAEPAGAFIVKPSTATDAVLTALIVSPEPTAIFESSVITTRRSHCCRWCSYHRRRCKRMAQWQDQLTVIVYI